MSANAQMLSRSAGVSISWPWLHSMRWDLSFLICSSVLVAVPLLLFHQFGVSTSAINIIVAALVGGPHMYSTYTYTALEPRFFRRYPLYTLGAALVPVAVITLAIVDLTLLLTLFLTWASLHVLHQIAWLTDCYQARGQQPHPLWSRAIDYAVVFTCLYPIAAYKLVNDQFYVEERVLQIPAFMKGDWFVVLAGLSFAIALAAWLGKSFQEWRSGRLNGSKTLLIGITVAISFFIPTAHNLDVAFQGMNTWHSFQYLALVWYLNHMRASRDEISLKMIRQLAGPGSGRRFYVTLVGITLAAGALVGLLHVATGLSLEQCYYMVVLSSLLVHYYFDGFIFTQSSRLVPSATGS